MAACRSMRLRTFGRCSPFFGRPRLRLGGTGGFGFAAGFSRASMAVASLGLRIVGMLCPA